MQGAATRWAAEDVWSWQTGAARLSSDGASCRPQSRVAGGRYNQISIAAVPLLPVFHRLPDPAVRALSPSHPAALLAPVRSRPSWPPFVLWALLWLPLAPALGADGAAVLRDIEQQFRRGESAPALQRLEQTLQARPADAGLRFLKAVILAASGRQAEAASLLERLTEDYPELPEPYNNLAVLLAAEGKLAQARSLLETALRLDPQYRTAHENLGDVYIRLAQRAYEAAAGPLSDPALLSKLRLTRDQANAR